VVEEARGRGTPSVLLFPCRRISSDSLRKGVTITTNGDRRTRDGVQIPDEPDEEPKEAAKESNAPKRRPVVPYEDLAGTQYDPFLSTDMVQTGILFTDLDPPQGVRMCKWYIAEGGERTTERYRRTCSTTWWVCSLWGGRMVVDIIAVDPIRKNTIAVSPIRRVW
jgi:hypothetical protein